MKRIYIIFLCALVVMGLGAERASASDAGFKASLVTSDAASRSNVEISGDGVVAAALLDGDSTLKSGRIEIDKEGKITLRLHLDADGDGFLLLNNADADQDGDRDFLFSQAFATSDGKVDADFDASLPQDFKVEDLLVTVLLDVGDVDNVLDANDRMVAVPGFIVGEEDDEDEFKVSGTVSEPTGMCPDVTFNVAGTPVRADADTEYDEGTCEDLFGEDVQVKVEGEVFSDINMASKVEFLDQDGPGEEIYCSAGEPCVGTNGNDIIYGTPDADQIDGGNGNDIIFGYGGNDIINGGNGTDELYGGDGDDQLFGGNGTDILDGEAGADLLDGGNGKDAIYCDGYDDVVESRGKDDVTGCN